jgi:hypothetical protein
MAHTNGREDQGRAARLARGIGAPAILAVLPLFSCSVLAPSDAELRGESVSSDSGTRSDAAGGGPGSEMDGAVADADSADAADAPDSDAAPQSPISKKNLVLWLMADSGVLHNSTAVSEWHDQSGAEYHARQSLKDSHPHLWPTGIAGKPALEFDGTADWLALPEGFAAFTGGISLFAIAQTRSLEQCASVLELSNGPEWDDIALGRTGAAVGYEVADTYIDEGLAAIPANTPVLLSATHAADGQARTFLNGLYSAQKSIPLPVNKRRTSSFVGQSLYEVCTPWNGFIGEIIVYNRHLDDVERKHVERYLQDKWGCCG